MTVVSLVSTNKSPNHIDKSVLIFRSLTNCSQSAQIDKSRLFQVMNIHRATITRRVVHTHLKNINQRANYTFLLLFLFSTWQIIVTNFLLFHSEYNEHQKTFTNANTWDKKTKIVFFLTCFSCSIPSTWRSYNSRRPSSVYITPFP